MGSCASWAWPRQPKGPFGWLVRDEQARAERVEAELDPALVPGHISSPLAAASASAPRTSRSPSRSRPDPRAVQDERGIHHTIGSDGCWTHHLIQVTAEAPAAPPSYEGSASRATG